MTIENLNAVYNSVNNDINNKNITIETYKNCNEIFNSMERVINQIIMAVKMLENVTMCDYDRSRNILTVRFNKKYAKEFRFYDSGISHNYYFNLDMKTLTYGTYDWDGTTSSYNGSYDAIRTELKKAGVKLTFATDAKKSFNNVIKFLKKSEIYAEFLKVYEVYNNASKNSFRLKVQDKLENDANDILIEYGFKHEFVKICSGGRYYLRLNNDTFKAKLYINGEYPKQKIAKLIKNITASNPQKFEIKKHEGTIVPILYINL